MNNYGITLTRENYETSGRQTNFSPYPPTRNFEKVSVLGAKNYILLLLSTLSLISPSFQGDPTIFQKGIFLQQTPHIKN